MTWATIWQGAIEALAAVARLTDHLDMFLSLSIACLLLHSELLFPFRSYHAGLNLGLTTRVTP